MLSFFSPATIENYQPTYPFLIDLLRYKNDPLSFETPSNIVQSLKTIAYYDINNKQIARLIFIPLEKAFKDNINEIELK